MQQQVPIILFDGENRENFAPISNTRAISAFRCGAFTIKERWEKWLKQPIETLTTPYLQGLYGAIINTTAKYIDACIQPSEELVDLIANLTIGTIIVDEKDNFIAAYSEGKIDFREIKSYSNKIVVTNIKRWQRPSDFYTQNEVVFAQDIQLMANTTQDLPTSNTVIGASEKLFIAGNLNAHAAIFNTLNGPIIIGKNVTIMEGACLRGPLFIGDNSVVKMGAKIYGATSIGPNCVVGGEIKNVIIQGNSNKAHDGYLGDSFVGEWCNFGAGTSNSNIKNTAGNVQMWNVAENIYENVGLKAGLLMGDYSRCAINSSINTGTVIGTCVNFFSSALSEKYIPDFSWGGNGNTIYIWEKVVADIANWKQLKNQQISEAETQVLAYLYKQQTEK